MNRRKTLATTAHLSRCRAADIIFSGLPAITALLVACFPVHADAQEVPRPSSARQVEKTSQPSGSGATFKVGEVLLRVEAHMSVEFVDNVDLTPRAKADLIFSPEVSVNATWAMTKLNTLQFRAGLGYAYYMNSPILNRQQTTITPDSALSFNVYAGDVKINFHDRFSLQQESASQGALSGIAQVERFTNTLGFSVLWDTNDIIWNFGYDHFTFLTLGGANSSSGSSAATLSRLDHSTDQFSASIAAKVNSAVIAGLEGTVAYSDYPKQSASNFTSITAGPYFEVQITKYTHMFLSGGFKGYYSGANAPGSVAVSSTVSAQPASGDPTGVYGNLSFVHKLNRFYSDHLDFTHSDDVEALSGHTQANTVRYGGAWTINRRMSLSAGLFFEDVRIISGSALGSGVASNFHRFGGSLTTGWQVSPRVGASLSYQYLKKQAVRATENYSQNHVTFSLGYRF